LPAEQRDREVAGAVSHLVGDLIQIIFNAAIIINASGSVKV
jgi:hypothetical protein